MKRTFLEELGLDKENIDKIMAEHGKTVETEKAKLSDKEQELTLINGQLEEANKTISSYENMNIDEVKMKLFRESL